MKWIGLFLLVSAAAFAQEAKTEVKEIKATGCVRKGVEAGCLLLKTLDGSATYNIFANPRPGPDTVITIEGKPHSGPTVCMEGIAIDVTKWEGSDEKCTQGAVEKPWDRVRSLKSGVELRILKKGGVLLAVMDEATDDKLIVVVRNEQMAIDRDIIERIDARPAGPGRGFRESYATTDPGYPSSVGPQPQGSRPGGPSASTGTSYNVGSRPDFETVYRRPPPGK